MKYIIVLLISIMCHNSYGQYSTYYGTSNVNSRLQINANVNSNVNVSGNLNKTITSIDYGSLALANAENEKTRLQSLQYANEIERQKSLEIASNPMKAFDYGLDNLWQLKSKEAREYGFDKLSWYHKVPHQSLFTRTSGYNYRNVSEKNIITELELLGAFKIEDVSNAETKANLLSAYAKLLENAEEFSKFPDDTVGVFSKIFKAFIHKKELKKASVFGVDGFKATIIYEDDYQLVIKDNYYASGNGIVLVAGVRYKGEKGEITFEELEGRRYYLKKLCEQIIATSSFPVAK
jgi:hypothetical protein